MTRIYAAVLFCVVATHSASPVFATDWAAYRAGSTRAAYVASEIPNRLTVRWSFVPSQSPRPAWPAPARQSYWQRLSSIAPRVVDDETFHPVVADGAVFFGSSADDSVYCLNAATGELRWQFTTDGPVRFAPAVDDSRVVVGSDDGCIYCLAADDGEIIWRRRLGLKDRRIPGNGRIISAWPIRTGLLVDDGIAYTTCGLFPSQTVLAYALDVSTGDIVWKRPVSYSTQGYLLSSQDRLFVPTGRANPIVLSKEDGRLVAQLEGVGGTYAVVAGNELVAGRGNDGTLAATDHQTRERLINFKGTQLAASPTTSYLVGNNKLRSIDRDQYIEFTRKINRKEAKRADLAKRIKELVAAQADADQIEPLRQQLDQAGQAIVQLEKDRSKCINWEVDAPVTTAMAACENQVVLGGDGKVVGVDVQDGSQLWQEEITGTALGIALSDGQVIISTDRGTVFCLSAEPLRSSAQADGVQGDGVKPSSTNVDRKANRTVKHGPSAGYPAEAATALATKIEGAMKGDLGRRGYCLILGIGNGEFASRIAQMGQHIVVAVDRDERRVEAARRVLQGSGMYGDRIAVHHIDNDRLPFTSHFANIVVCRSAIDGGDPDWSDDEIDRVLSPENGFAWVRKGAMPHQREPLENVGEWSHLYANPSNTSNSGGRGVGRDAMLQWFGGPGPNRMVDRHLRAPAPLCVGGRLFVPGENELVAVDAYNGTELWDLKLPGSQRYSMPYDAGYMTATTDQVVVAVGGEARSFSAENGQLLYSRSLPENLKTTKSLAPYQKASTQSDDPDSTATPEHSRVESETGAKAHWGYLAIHDGNTAATSERKAGLRLIGTAQKPTASRTTPTRGRIDHDYGNGQPVVTSDAAFCIDTDGTTQWTYRRGLIVNPTITMGGGKMFFVECRNKGLAQNRTGRVELNVLLQSDAFLVALDTTTGEVVLETALGENLSRCNNILYLQYVATNTTSGLLVATGSYHGGDDDSWYRIGAFDAANGKSIWTAEHAHGKKGEFNHGEQVHHPVILGRWLVAEPVIYDLATGSRVNPNGDEAPWAIDRPGHSCGTMSGSGSCLYFRADNPTVLDLSSHVAESERFRRLSPSRLGCWINVIPAGGLLLIPEASAGCVCHYSLQMSMAFLPAGQE